MEPNSLEHEYPTVDKLRINNIQHWDKKYIELHKFLKAVWVSLTYSGMLSTEVAP
jgi:hypothetical protein